MAISGVTTGGNITEAWGDSVAEAINDIAPSGYVAAARARRSGYQSVNNVTNTVILWDSEDYDTDAFHSTSTNTSRLTVPTGLGGMYWIGYYVDCLNGTGVVASWITLSGGVGRFAYNQSMNSAGNGPILNGSDILAIADGGYIELNVYQNSGAALNVAGIASSFHMARLGQKQ